MSKSTDNTSAVWSEENRSRLQEGWQYPHTNTSAPQDTQQQQQPSSQQHSNTEQPLDTDPTTQLAAFFASQPQISSAPYQQQPQRVFGQLLPIIGPNQFILDEEFRAAAKKSPMLWAFMQAVDQAEKEWQERVEVPH